MSLEFVDVSRVRAHADQELKLSRAIDSRKISKQASREADGPLSGLFKGRLGPPMPATPANSAEYPWIYTEYVTGLSSILAKSADSYCQAGGEIEAELTKSADVHHATRDILGGGVENPYLGLAGAVGSICIRHAATKKLGAAGQKKPAVAASAAATGPKGKEKARE